MGRKRISKEARDLIFRMVDENPTWGSPRIHGELLMLGFDVSERTISRWMRHAPRNPEPAKRWLAFLRNHREAIAAMDFFTIPTVTFSLLYWRTKMKTACIYGQGTSDQVRLPIYCTRVMRVSNPIKESKMART